MRNRLYSGVALAVVAMVAAAPAHAQQQKGQDVELETINVEGQGASKGEAAAPGNEEPAVATEQKTPTTSRITRQEIEQRQINEVRDIGRLEPGVSFSESSQSFNVRGLDRARVLTTIDGIPVPWIDDVGGRGSVGNVTSFGGVSTFNFNSLSELDIIKGSDSSIFGSGGIGGVVAFRTLDPEDLIDPGESWGGLSKLSYDTKDDSLGADQAVAGRVDNTWFMVQGGYREGNEIENKGGLDVAGPTRTEKNPDDYDQYNVLAKLHHYVDGGHMFSITGELFERNDDIGKYTASTSNTLPFSATSEELAKRERVSLHYKYDPEETGGGWFDAADAVAYWQRQDTEADYRSTRIGSLSGPFQRITSFEREIYGTSANALKIFDTDDIEHRVAFGGNIQGSKEHQYSAGEDQCDEILPTPPAYSSLRTNMSDMPDVDGLAFGAYVQDEIALFGDTVRVTPGVRFDWYEYQPQLTDAFERNPIYPDQGLPGDNSDSAVSGKLRFEADTIYDVTLFAQWAQGFRAPTANELFLTGGAPNSYLVIGNPDLKPETSNGFDIGLLAGDEKLGGSLTFFYTDYDDFIDGISYDDPDGEYMFIQEYRNLSDADIYGAEVSAHIKHESGWHGWGNLGAYVGTFEDPVTGDRKHLNTVPAAKIMLGVGYGTDEWGADVIYTGVASRDLNDVEHVSSVTPGYSLVDLTAWWSPGEVEGLTLRAGVYNVFDVTYWETLDFTSTIQNKRYYTEPGRTFKASAVYKF